MELRRSILLSLVLFGGLLFFSECQKDRFLDGRPGNFCTQPDQENCVHFSQDTVLFDTLFTTVNSITKKFKVYNDRDEALNLDQVMLAGGDRSQYRINVDGQPGDMHRDVRIPANDSIHIFVEARLDQTGANDAMVVVDSILFQSGSNTGKVELAAWGQDAHFHQNVLYGCNGGSIVWSNDKPHVVYGTAAIDTNCTLTIEAGTQVYFHGSSRLVVLQNGKLDVQGTKSEKVIFQGDRLQPIYDDEPGQWERIWLIENQGSQIEHAVIKNAVIGLQVDSVGMQGTPAVTLDQTIIKDASSTGLLAQAGAHIVAENSLFRDCGRFVTALTSGGRYEMTHCTFANYWDHSERSDPAFVLSNYYETQGGQEIVRPIEQSHFTNCIFYGTREEEFVVDTKSGASEDYLFEHCLVKTEDAPSGSKYDQIFVNESPGFRCTANSEDCDPDYRPENGAFPIDKGKTGTGVNVDLNENPRDADPDLGAYEKQ